MPDQSEKPLPKGFLNREEIRGLFTLGLLAVAVSIRIQNKEITLTINNNPFNITVFFDTMILLWSFYAFFMILGLSDDIIGENISKTFRKVSTFYLYLSFAALGLLAVIFYYSAYQIQSIGLSIIGLTLVLYWSVKKVYSWSKKTHNGGLSLKSGINNQWKKLKSESYQFLLSIFGICFILVTIGTKEEFIIPSAIVGSIFLVLFLVARDWKKKKKIAMK
jgi:hypothetical protein